MSNKKKGTLFIISAPAGTGKTTIVDKLIKLMPHIHQTVSVTSRKPRRGEKEGVHYHFVSDSEFEKLIDKGEFFEYVKLYDHYYGTPKSQIKMWQDKGHPVILIIDVQGMKKITALTDAVTIFISPPSFEVLRERLIKRNTDTEEEINKRLSVARLELKEKDQYNYQIINNDLTEAVEALKSIIEAEEHKTSNLK